MYICDECGHIFEEPTTWEERHGFTQGPFEQWSGCPRCKGSYEETKLCGNCGEHISKSSSSNLCQACREEVLERMKHLLNNEFMDAEREFLSEYIDETIMDFKTSCSPAQVREKGAGSNERK